jgi:hypothetical protein
MVWYVANSYNAYDTIHAEPHALLFFLLQNIVAIIILPYH